MKEWKPAKKKEGRWATHDAKDATEWIHIQEEIILFLFRWFFSSVMHKFLVNRMI